MASRAIGEPGGGIMHELLAEMKERITGIAEALTQLEQRDHAQTGLHNLQAHLLNMLKLIERDAGITAAADDLLSTATAFIEGDHPARGCLLREAFQRFQDRLQSAHLSEHGRMLGLE
jgi:hypothetical protein